MQVTLSGNLNLSASDRAEAQAALRKCVHCGMCNATCPTFQLTGDELEGPRGRIYLMKSVLEGESPSRVTLQHLDRCLSCRACETTCPSQVPYTRLADIGRRVTAQTLEQQGQGRPWPVRMLRWVLRESLTRPRLFAGALGLGRALAPILPRGLRAKVPARRPAGAWAREALPHRVVLLQGCVQPALDPGINAATSRVFHAVGVECLVAPLAGCCGAIRYHLDDVDGGLQDMRRNIDAWIPLLDAGAQAIVSTASGCGQMISEYGHLLRDDPAYAERARRVSERFCDVSEALLEHLDKLKPPAGAEAASKAELESNPESAVYHPPCTLQHGLRVRGAVEKLLAAVGVKVSLCVDSHICCGSAGTYSIAHPVLAGRLRDEKLANLNATGPNVILTANIGCQTHLQGGTPTPVRHWIEWLDHQLALRSPTSL